LPPGLVVGFHGVGARAGIVLSELGATLRE
jgi:hypothetical protein